MIFLSITHVLDVFVVLVVVLIDLLLESQKCFKRNLSLLYNRWWHLTLLKLS